MIYRPQMRKGELTNNLNFIIMWQNFWLPKGAIKIGIIFLIYSSSAFDYGQKDGKKFGDESTSIYSQHFSPEYAFILENSDTLEAQFKKQPAHLERLYGK